ncbi:hypothetical protein CHS0354_013004 [Potamilus streckersoni]|uniref:Uncharacterized protein n=1 Tax=Potamilus streckersoni TaxID=2493646 RepID=A0AAE0T855_9BIVA|nr:hypothetical protein CHS0354_013004 [Potamilus streckersoni]
MAMEQDWWKNRMAEDIYATLRMKEQSLAMYQGHSRQLWMRQCLVNWLGVVTTAEYMCNSSAPSCIPVGFLSGWAGVKFEDHTEQLPKFNTLIQFLPWPTGRMPPVSSISPTIPSYTIEQYISVEHAVLQYFDWELAVPDVPHFVPYYLQVSVDDDDLINGIPIVSKPVVKSYVEKHTLYFQQVCLLGKNQ